MRRGYLVSIMFSVIVGVIILGWGIQRRLAEVPESFEVTWSEKAEEYYHDILPDVLSVFHSPSMMALIIQRSAGEAERIANETDLVVDVEDVREGVAIRFVEGGMVTWNDKLLETMEEAYERLEYMEVESGWRPRVEELLADP